MSSPDSVVRRRPDVAAAERQLAVERALVGAAKADYLPRLSRGGSAGYTAGELRRAGRPRDFPLRGGSDHLLAGAQSGPGQGPGGPVPRPARRRRRHSTTQTVLRALQDVEISLVRYRTARTRVERIQDAAAASERAAELARLRFTGGVADFLQVLDAERTQLEAQDQLAQSRTDAATAYAALYKALGGSWPSAN